VNGDKMKNQIKKYFEKEGYSVSFIKKFEKGSSRNTYIVQTKDKKLLLKLFDKNVEGKIKKNMTFLKKFNEGKELCINPLNKKIVNLGNKIGFYYSYFEGEPVEKIKLKNKLEIFSTVVGIFNRRSIKVGGVKSENKFLKEQTLKARKSLNGLRDNKIKQFHPFLELIKEGIEKMPRDLMNKNYRKILVHQDLHMNNILYNKKQKRFLIIDVEDLNYNILVREITVIISYELTNSMRRNRKLISKIINSYEKEIKLQRKEKNLIPSLLIQRKIGEIRYLLNQRKKNVLTQKQFDYYMNNSVRQFKIILKNFDELTLLFKKL
jgi:Ser/Thr protein kinase RdoA (MazF antagonist)